MADSCAQPFADDCLGKRLEQDVPEVAVPGREDFAVGFGQFLQVGVDMRKHGLAVAIKPIEVGQANPYAFAGIIFPRPFRGVRSLLL